MIDLLVRRPEDLESIRRRSASGRIRVALAPNLGGSDVQRARLERQINRSLAACGCNEGTVAGILYLGTAVVLAWRDPSPLGGRGWLVALGGFLFSLLLGKTAGLLLARWRLHRAVSAVGGLDRPTSSAG